MQLLDIFSIAAYFFYYDIDCDILDWDYCKLAFMILGLKILMWNRL